MPDLDALYAIHCRWYAIQHDDNGIREEGRARCADRNADTYDDGNYRKRNAPTFFHR
ncbi:hypothetical protein JCM17961_34540 [Endothiovibrio diazotrophicus]